MFGYGIGRIINVVLIAGKPAFSGKSPGLTQILISLFDFQWSQEFLMRWLIVLAFLAACYTFFISIIFRNIPITIISTKIEVKFNKQDFSEVELYREQLLRANEPNVSISYL
jgi:hypothetical protein